MEHKDIQRELQRSPLLHLPPSRLCRSTPNLTDVMLSKATHLALSSCHKAEILRLRLRMTLRHSLVAGERREGAQVSSDMQRPVRKFARAARTLRIAMHRTQSFICDLWVLCG